MPDVCQCFDKMMEKMLAQIPHRDYEPIHNPLFIIMFFLLIIILN